MKALVSGAAVALASGLLMGSALRPDFSDLDRPAGPQIVTGFDGVRATGPFDDGPTLASFHGKLPDYVLGTDFKTATTVYPTAEAPPPAKATDDAATVKVAVKNDAPPQVPLTQASYEDAGDDDAAATPPPSYPSIDGGAPEVDPAAASTTASTAQADQDSQANDPTAG